MKMPHHKTPDGHAQASTDAPGPLAELKGLLAEQISLARAGKLDQASALVGSVERLIRQASACLSSRGNQQMANDIRRLYDELCLTLKGQESELADQLRRVRVGKSSLGAYRDASSSL